MLPNRIRSLFVIVVVFLAAFVSTTYRKARETSPPKEGHAFHAFDYWYNQRATPGGLIPHHRYIMAAENIKTSLANKTLSAQAAGDTSVWRSIGPTNVGGRILAIALNPVNPEIVWVGSASGGLWKSTNSGYGADAWDLVSTGYPTIAVSSIAINPLDPDVMYIGTGEVGSGYKYTQVGTPGARATYGMGILKSTDGGVHWDLTGLTWQFSEITAVQKVLLNPLNPQTVFAATSEGTYRSLNGGATWARVHDVLMAMDIVINPADTSILYTANGQRNTTPNSGIHRSTDGGTSWSKLTVGLPASQFGRTSLSISQSNPAILYAGIAHAGNSQLLGLYRTTNGGAEWVKIATTPNYVGSQGWYDNVVAIHPTNANVVLCSGLDIYKTTSAGTHWSRRSYWYNGGMFTIPPGGPEGSLDYAHADHHSITFHPTDPNIIYFGTDGGVFMSTDGGETFDGRNGGLITTQFYTGFADASTNASIALGGLQDNGTLKYEGDPAWSKVYGGDGGWCAIDPINHDILYEEYVFLQMSKSTNGGYNWYSIMEGIVLTGGDANFIAPFVISPTHPDILYAGAKTIYKSTNGGEYWETPNNGINLNGTTISTIGISHQNPDTLMAGTGGYGPLNQIFASYDGGVSWERVSDNLPRRYPTDITFDPSSSLIAYITFSGYGTPHVYKTIDAGKHWIDITSNLPDIPVQAVTPDPAFPDHLYAATDLGVFRSLDGGASWSPFMEGMPPAMVLDLNVAAATRMLRASTFGNGIYERPLPSLQALTVSVPVVDGWNILSLPVMAENPDITTVFPEASSSAYGFNGRYTLEDSLIFGHGYWVNMGSGDSVRITGIPTNLALVNVRKGWNLIGAAAYPVPLSRIRFSPPALSISQIYGYDGGYTIASTLMPGSGYWVKCDRDGTLMLDLTPPVTPPADGNTANIRRFSSLTMYDAAGRHQTLFLTSGALGEREFSTYELPPEPPGSGFDVRFVNRKCLDILSDSGVNKSEFIVRGALYPLEIRWKIPSHERDAMLVYGDERLVLRGSGTAVVSEPAESFSIIPVPHGSVPQGYALGQNYPNPFNPATTIMYDLPEPSRVEFRIYDPAGRLVTVRDEGIRDAGTHSLLWNAAGKGTSGLASGVYFYVLRATAYTSGREVRLTKKMLLMQ